MIVVALRGGLGNQMFQYATGLNLALKNGVPLVLDTTFLHDRFPRRGFTYRTYDMDIFSLMPRFTVLSKISDRFPMPGVWAGLDLAGIVIGAAFGVRKFVREKKYYAFDPEVFRAGGNAVLWGRWQNEKYFSDIKNEIRREFHFKDPLQGEANALAAMIHSSNSVSLHVRRGDYAAVARVTQQMGETDVHYYFRAVAYAGERVKDARFFVFSDDIAWCKKNIQLPFPTTYVSDATRGPKASYHLELMSLCKHNIITNSTFSWWGGWLNRNPKKIVIAPRRWFKEISEDDCDVVPAEWTKL